MPIDYARRLTGTVRTTRVNTHLGVGLAFVAGIVTDIGIELGKYVYVNRHELARVMRTADGGQGLIATRRPVAPIQRSPAPSIAPSSRTNRCRGTEASTAVRRRGVTMAS